jgi:predicted glutamine amidotransferase
MVNAYLVHFGATNNHGTGLAYLDDSRMTVIKRKQPAIDFVLKNHYQIRTKAMIGHLRLACSGKVCDKNSHPFTSCSYSKKKIALAHNGMLSNYEAVKKEFKKRHDFKSDVDSEILLHFYEEYGEDFIKKLNEKKITGMANIIMLEEDGTILAYSDGNLYIQKCSDRIVVLQDKLYSNCRKIEAGMLVKIKNGRIISETDIGILKVETITYGKGVTDYTNWSYRDGFYVYDKSGEKGRVKDENEGYLPEVESALCENFGLEHSSITVLQNGNRLNITICDVDPIQFRELNKVFSCFAVVDSSGEDYVDIYGRIKLSTFQKRLRETVTGDSYDN